MLLLSHPRCQPGPGDARLKTPRWSQCACSWSVAHHRRWTGRHSAGRVRDYIQAEGRKLNSNTVCSACSCVILPKPATAWSAVALWEEVGGCLAIGLIASCKLVLDNAKRLRQYTCRCIISALHCYSTAPIPCYMCVSHIRSNETTLE